MPVRKPKKNYRSLTGMFYSLKNKKGIFFESKLERDLFLTLEFDQRVISYEEQPIKISYQKNGRTYPYTPDCLVHYKKETSCIIEVKYSDEIKADTLTFKDKFHQTKQILKERGMRFRLFTERNINPISLNNMKFLYNFVTIKDQSMIEDIHNKIILLGSSSYIKLLDNLANDKHTQALYSPYIWHLVLIGKLKIDMSKELTPNTYIEVIK